MKVFAALLFLLAACHVQAQTIVPCTEAGQNPGTAFPVCGTAPFSQTSVPLCGGRELPSPACNGVLFADVNPYWYKFTCYQAGTLGFIITPNINTEDYDWQLYDITGHDPNDVYRDASLVIANNWSGETGPTGASPAGISPYVCDGTGRSLFSKMPNLVVGHDYLLMISHFTRTQSGYTLAFDGGTATITDTTRPRLRTVESGCGGAFIRVKLNKRMKCSTLAGDGSDFFITPAAPAIVSATGIGCATGFDTDSLELKLASVAAPGNYVLHVKTGGDGNTLLDLCDNELPDTSKAAFTVLPLFPTPMDSLSPVKCKPQSLVLVFSKPVLCSSVAADGSDFTVSGSYPVSVTDAHGSCSAGGTLTKEVVVNLSQPLYDAGSFTLTLRRGSDGNTLTDECSLETPAGSSLSFTVKDTVDADFTYIKTYGCTTDTVRFLHPGGNGVNSWHWQLGNGQTSTLPNPEAYYNVFGNKQVSLAVSNGFCADSSSRQISLDNFLSAGFSVYEDICPNEPVTFTSQATGIKLRHNWVFGDGGTSSTPSPAHTYGNPFTTRTYTVQYTVTDSIGCSITKSKPVTVYSSCFLAVPTAFTPNNDGLNDFLGPLNGIKVEQLDFRIFNRWGQLVYQTNNWKLGWDGNFRGQPQPTATYVWFLSYIDRDTKQRHELKGTAVLIR